MGFGLRATKLAGEVKLWETSWSIIVFCLVVELLTVNRQFYPLRLAFTEHESAQKWKQNGT